MTGPVFATRRTADRRTFPARQRRDNTATNVEVKRARSRGANRRLLGRSSWGNRHVLFCLQACFSRYLYRVMVHSLTGVRREGLYAVFTSSDPRFWCGLMRQQLATLGRSVWRVRRPLARTPRKSLRARECSPRRRRMGQRWLRAETRSRPLHPRAGHRAGRGRGHDIGADFGRAS